MPVFHAHIPKGRFGKEQKKAIGNALNQSLIQGLGIPPGDRFIIISEHAEDELFIDPTFMGMERSENAMIINVLSRVPGEMALAYPFHYVPIAY